MTNVSQIPLILPESAKSGAVYAPFGDFVTYLGRLLDGGFTPEMLPAGFYDLYVLDFYDAQVRNGGHSQFIHNCFDNLSDNLAGALRGAHALGLTQSAELLAETTAWIAAHPEEAAAQTGFDVRAQALEPLDKRLYANVFSPAEREAFFETQPAAFKRWWERAVAENDFYAHNKHHICGAAWVHAHPDLKYVPDDTWGDEIQAVINANPEAAREMRIRKLEKSRDFVPDAIGLALGRALGQAYGGGILAGIMPRDVSGALEAGRTLKIALQQGEVFARLRQDTLTLHRAWTPKNYGAQGLAQLLMPFIPASKRLDFLIWTGQPKPGRMITWTPVEPDVEDLVTQLHISEALALWSQDPELSITFPRGALMRADLEAEIFEWWFYSADKQFALIAEPNGVRFKDRQTGEAAYFPMSKLASYRAAHLR